MTLRRSVSGARRGLRRDAVNLVQVVALIDEALKAGASGDEAIQFRGKGLSDKAVEVWFDVEPSVRVRQVVVTPEEQQPAPGERSEAYEKIGGGAAGPEEAA